MISHHTHTFECDIPTDTQHNFENIDPLSNGTDNSKHKLGLKFIVIFLSNSKKINYYYYYYLIIIILTYKDIAITINRYVLLGQSFVSVIHNPFTAQIVDFYFIFIIRFFFSAHERDSLNHHVHNTGFSDYYRNSTI